MREHGHDLAGKLSHFRPMVDGKGRSYLRHLAARGGTTVVASTYIHDPVANSWSTGAPVPTARSNAIAGELCGLLWVIGGIDNAMVNMTVVEAYDPVTDTWCTGPSKPTPLAEGGSSGITRPGAIHAVGGGHSGASVTAHEVLELASCSLTTPRAMAEATSSEGSEDW